MTTFIGIVGGLIIGWLLMLNHDTDQRLRQATEELTEARSRNIDLSHALAKTEALATETARQLAIVSSHPQTCKPIPFGDDYVRPYSLINKN